MAKEHLSSGYEHVIICDLSFRAAEVQEKTANEFSIADA